MVEFDNFGRYYAHILFVTSEHQRIIESLTPEIRIRLDNYYTEAGRLLEKRAPESAYKELETQYPDLTEVFSELDGLV